MLNGLYSAAAGMDAAQARHETAATNLASAQQPGFRRTQVGRGTFEAAVLAVQHQEGRDAGPNQSGDLLDFREGTMQLTGRGLDLAIQGDGFFVVDGPEGLLYTRNGRFFVNEASELVTVDGLPLQGTAGPIRLPPGTSTEALQVTSDGRVMDKVDELGRLNLVRFEDPNHLQRAGKSLFSAPDSVVGEPAEVIVQQGMLEGSNVSPITELIELIASSRQYEAASQAMQSITQATAKHINTSAGN